MEATGWYSATGSQRRWSVEPRIESFDNAAGEPVYRLIVTRAVDGEQMRIQGSSAEWDELFRLFTLQRR